MIVFNVSIIALIFVLPPLLGLACLLIQIGVAISNLRWLRYDCRCSVYRAERAACAFRRSQSGNYGHWTRLWVCRACLDQMNQVEEERRILCRSGILHDIIRPVMRTFGKDPYELPWIRGGG